MIRSVVRASICAAIAAALTLHVAVAVAAATGDRAPELVEAREWIGSEPLSIAALRGRVVLVNFWTFGCHNCRNTLPTLARWHDRYQERGLTILGVHAPEFAWERGREAVGAAVRKHGIRWAVVLDDDMRSWNAYGNRYWPAFYFVDRRGVIRHVRFGEGGYAQGERWIEELLAETP